MYYVELLRVGRALRVAAILLVAAFLLNLLLFKMAAHGRLDPQMGISLSMVWAFAGVVTCIFASAIASGLAFENDGHLPLAWTKPVSRATHALVKIGLDLAAIAVMFTLTAVAVVAYLSIVGSFHSIAPTPDNGAILARYLLGPAAFYGLIQALTSGLGKQAGLVTGFTWLGCFVLVALQLSALPASIHALVDFVSYANPLVYVAFGVVHDTVMVEFPTLTALLALTLIAGLGSALAIVRWQRVEA